MIEEIKSFLDNRSILILGFGREGRSTYEFIKKYVKPITLAIADKEKPECDEQVFFGEDYLSEVDKYDVVIKSPGIPFFNISEDRVTSQTDLLLKFNKKNIIGITGTKGKSTTSSLIYKILKDAGRDCALIGNIGIPPFDCLESVKENTILVFEMSSHQLEHVQNSPHTAVILNIFEEHLDHYKTYEGYQLAKVNIFRYQDSNDVVVYNKDNELVRGYIEKFSKGRKLAFPYELNIESNLLGEHNKKNIMAAVLVAREFGISDEEIRKAVKGFEGLEHRLEFAGEFDGIKFYDDSISTIPEATIMAVKSLKDADTVIIGGMDRGINYDELVDFLNTGIVRNVICVYSTGEKIYKELKVGGAKLADNLEEAIKIAKAVTAKGKSCVLSPAAASYGYFKNFEERGNIFKELIKK